MFKPMKSKHRKTQKENDQIKTQVINQTQIKWVCSKGLRDSASEVKKIQ